MTSSPVTRLTLCRIFNPIGHCAIALLIIYRPRCDLELFLIDLEGLQYIACHVFNTNTFSRSILRGGTYQQTVLRVDRLSCIKFGENIGPLLAFGELFCFRFRYLALFETRRRLKVERVVSKIETKICTSFAPPYKNHERGGRNF